MAPPFLASAGPAPSRALASERASLVVTAKQPGPAPLLLQSLPRSTFWAAAGSRATMRAGPICTERTCAGLSRSGTTTAAAQTSNLEGTYALTFRCFHALAGSHDSGSVSRASRRFRSLAHLRGTSRSPLRTWIVGGGCGGTAAGRRLGVSEPSCRDDLGSQELDSLACEALLEEAAERLPSTRNTKPDQPPVGVHPAPAPRAPDVVDPVVHLEHSALGSTRRRSHRRQPDDALVDDEGAHGERRGADHAR